MNYVLYIVYTYIITYIESAINVYTKGILNVMNATNKFNKYSI